MKTTKSKTQKATNSDETPITRGMMLHMFENMKDFTLSTAKASETKLGIDMSGIEHAVTHRSKLIKDLDAKITGVRTELKEEMQGMRTELKGEIQGVRTELIEKMNSVESNLTEKIEGQKSILQNHEDRITALESL